MPPGYPKFIGYAWRAQLVLYIYTTPSIR